MEVPACHQTARSSESLGMTLPLSIRYLLKEPSNGPSDASPGWYLDPGEECWDCAREKIGDGDCEEKRNSLGGEFP